MARSERVPESLQSVYNEITALTDQFSAEHLNAEYAQLCREMAAALARIRPSPLLTGKVGTSACGLVYTLGQVNFLTDRSFTQFGLRPATGSAKAKDIRRLLKISGQFEPDCTLPSQLDRNPLAWLISVNGLVMDARHMPYEVQVEAAARGLIPYLPPQEEDN